MESQRLVLMKITIQHHLSLWWLYCQTVLFKIVEMCVWCAAPPAAVGPVHQQLQGEEECRAGPAGPGAGRRLQGRCGPRASRKTACQPEPEPVGVFCFVFCLVFHAAVWLQECCSSHAGMWYLKGTIESWHWAAVPSCTHPAHPPPGWEGSQVDDSNSELGQPEGQWSGQHQAFFLFSTQEGGKKSSRRGSADVETCAGGSDGKFFSWICGCHRFELFHRYCYQKKILFSSSVLLNHHDQI